MQTNSHVRNHIVPHIGDRRLDRIDGSALNELYAFLLKSGRRNGRELAPNSVHRVHVVLHRAFRDAVRWGFLTKNPAANADPPKLRPNGMAEMTTWSAEELKSFLELAVYENLYPLWFVMATTGLRRGEALGLRWRDVDLERSEAAIRQTVVTHDYKTAFSEPKTAKGRRVVALDDHTVAELRRYKARQAPDTEDALLFCYSTGNPLSPNDVTKHFVELVEEIGLRRIRLHDLRHTHATLALQAGVHPKIVSERLGHATISFTLDVYSHAIPHLQKEAAGQVAELIFEPVTAPVQSPEASPRKKPRTHAHDHQVGDQLRMEFLERPNPLQMRLSLVGPLPLKKTSQSR